MKRAARVTLAIVILLAGLLLLPRPASRIAAPDAFGQIPATKLPTIIATSPSPSPSKTIKPTQPPESPKPPDDPKKPDKKDNNDNRGDKKNNETGDKKGLNKGDKKNGKGLKNGVPIPANTKFNATGEFDTERLQLIAAQLRAHHISEQKILKAVYAPFIIGGPAAWTNTWGAPRYGPGPIVRTHEGQDVFCKYGDPVLAAEAGTIEFDNGGLGGRVARLYRKGGSYWYYAHLSDWNTKDFTNGDRVEVGDVIGYCGNTGNALTTPPHVHFGWYQASGQSKDPMGYLVRWLRLAERRATINFRRITGKRMIAVPETTSKRLFGEGFEPDISELKISSEALLSASSAPGAGAFGLAEAALQAALAGTAGEVYQPGDLSLVGGAGAADSHLSELLDSTFSSPKPDGSD